MSGEGAGMIQPSAESELATGIQRVGIKFPGQSLFAKSQETIAIRIDAYIDRRFQAVVQSIETAAFKHGAERAEKRAARFLFRHEFCAAHVAASKPDLPVRKPERANHAVAIEPVLVRKAIEPEACRSIQIVRPVQERGDLPYDLFNRVIGFRELMRKGTLNAWRKVGQIGGGSDGGRGRSRSRRNPRFFSRNYRLNRHKHTHLSLKRHIDFSDLQCNPAFNRTEPAASADRPASAHR